MSELSEAPIESTEKPTKAKRVLSEAQLENLKAARVKALLKKKELGEIKKREKSVKEELLNQRIKQIETMESKVSKKAPKKPIVESESESETESESSEEEEIKPTKKQTKKPNATEKVKKMSTTKISTDIAKDELRNRILHDSYKSAFESIFPNHRNIFN
jgi:hypothetical protein